MREWHSRSNCSGVTIRPVILPDDFNEFLRSLNDHDVKYMVVGGHAVSFHGYPRFTHDVDVVILPDEPNARALLAALSDFGFADVELGIGDFLKPTTVVLGRPPDQIDIMTFIKGVDVYEAWARRVPGVLDGVDVAFIAKQDLIANKRAVGRPEDLADIARLGE
jgi:predicted nucleotidyltransferase